MSAAKHTPGPWSFVDHSWCDKSVYARLHETDERRIALFHLDEDASEDEEAVEIANARLIAAAPELLDALQSLLFDAEQFAKVIPPYQNAESIALARAAIVKATGRAA